MADEATVAILIEIREQLAGLTKTRDGLREVKKDAESVGALLKQGLGVGSGMELARRGVDLLRESFRASIGGAFDLAEEIRDQGDALNFTAEAYQVLRYEMMQGGVEAARLTMAVTTQNQSFIEARSGVGAFAQAYKTLGLNAGELEKAKPEERILAVVRAVSGATDKTKAFGAAGQILGQRGLPQLLASLQNLAENGYDKVAKSARDAGKVMGDDMVDMLDRAKQRLDNFKATTLPIAAGTAIAMLQNTMDFVGSAAGNLVNLFEGKPTVAYIDEPSAPRPSTPAGTSYANAEQVLNTRASAAETKAAAIQNASLLNETEKRRAMLPILKEQEELYTKLIELRFGDTGKTLPADGKVTEEELARYQLRNELESKLVAIRQQRMENVDTPLANLGRSLADTTTYAQQAIAGGLSSSLDNLVSGITAATNGTQSWGSAFRNLGTSAAGILQQIITRMLVIQTINMALGIFGFSLNGNASGVVKVPATVTAAGGGDFVTRGPTTLTVGDNPGGIEHVSVTPISGVGTSTVNGRAVKMGGGGSLTAAGAGGDVFNFNYAFNGGVSRDEVMALIPTIVEASKSAVIDAKRRGRDGFR